MTTPRLALEGGPPVRTSVLPYSRQCLEEEDIQAVLETLRSDWLTTGPRVEAFEEAFASAVGAIHAVAVANGTAALHAAVAALEIGPGDEVIVPPITFAATANAVAFQGATPVFADVEPENLLLDPDRVAARIGPRTRAVIAVDFAGHPCDYAALEKITRRQGVVLVADACHALGASYRGRPVGGLGDLNTFSFHPVKPLTSAEGGMITCSDPALARRMRRFRNHGITSDYRQREREGSWFYEMVELGYNYRLSDLHCALGLSQLKRLQERVRRRQQVAARYDVALADLPAFVPLERRPDVSHSYHLYVVRLRDMRLRQQRQRVFQSLRAEGIGVNVHYIPVHLHPFYTSRFGTARGLCPVAEAAYEEILSIPVFAGMSDTDVDDVVSALAKVAQALGC